MTKAAAQFGKRLDDFWRTKETQEYVAELNRVIPGNSGIIDAKRGYHGNPQTGTFGHPKLAVFFARWLDVRFAVWCDMQIDDIVRGGSVGKVAVKETVH